MNFSFDQAKQALAERHGWIENIYNNLLPCPFCGGKPREDVWFLTDEGSDHWEIKCDCCGCRMRHDRSDKVVGFWNNRITDGFYPGRN